jgi:hypothetical protein
VAALVQVCLEADYDAATATCTSPYYAPMEAGWPALSLEGAQEIGAACALLWSLAWVFRRLKKQIDQS